MLVIKTKFLIFRRKKKTIETDPMLIFTISENIENGKKDQPKTEQPKPIDIFTIDKNVDNNKIDFNCMKSSDKDFLNWLEKINNRVLPI